MHFFIYFCAILASSTATLPVEYQHDEWPASLGINSNLKPTERALAVGANSFLDLLSKGTFVDKSLLLHDLLNRPIWLSVVICPTKWGKTVNLHMMKTFLEMKIRSDGTRMLPNTTENYKLFVHGQYRSGDYDIKLENPLLIAGAKYRNTVDTYLGQHPVVYMSFAGVATNFEKNYTTILGELVAKAYDDHKYILKFYDEVLQDAEAEIYLQKHAKYSKKKFLSYLNCEKGDRIDFEKGIDFLVQELFERFQQTVCILFDDYDQLFRWDAPEMIVPDFLEVKLFAGKMVEKGMLAGITPKMFRETEMIVNQFLYTPLPFYGFTAREMDLIYYYYNISDVERDRVNYWYAGHMITEKNITREMFCPSSVCNYIQSRQLQPYWVDAEIDDDTLGDIFELSRFKFIFAHLLAGESYALEYRRDTDKDWFHLNSTNDLKQSLFYLHYTGYLTKTKTRLQSTDLFRYWIPNQEITSGLQTILAAKYRRQFDPHLRELIDRTANLWEPFLLGDELKSPELEKFISSSYKTMLRYSKKDPYRATGGALALVRTVIAVSLATKQLRFVNTLFAQTANGTNKRPDVVLSSENRGYIIDVKFGQNTTTVESRTSAYIEIFKQYPALYGWKDTKFVFFDLTPSDSVNIFSALHSNELGES